MKFAAIYDLVVCTTKIRIVRCKEPYLPGVDMSLKAPGVPVKFLSSESPEMNCLTLLAVKKTFAIWQIESVTLTVAT